jgi:hypothetical protein
MEISHLAHVIEAIWHILRLVPVPLLLVISIFNGERRFERNKIDIVTTSAYYINDTGMSSEDSDENQLRPAA